VETEPPRSRSTRPRFLPRQKFRGPIPVVRDYGDVLAQTPWAALPTLVGIAGSLFISRRAIPRRRFAILLTLCLAARFASLLFQIRAPTSERCA
jgi:hypothetical protein